MSEGKKGSDARPLARKGPIAYEAYGFVSSCLGIQNMFMLYGILFMHTNPLSVFTLFSVHLCLFPMCLFFFFTFLVTFSPWNEKCVCMRYLRVRTRSHVSVCVCLCLCEAVCMNSVYKWQMSESVQEKIEPMYGTYMCVYVSREQWIYVYLCVAYSLCLACTHIRRLYVWLWAYIYILWTYESM